MGMDDHKICIKWIERNYNFFDKIPHPNEISFGNPLRYSLSLSRNTMKIKFRTSRPINSISFSICMKIQQRKINEMQQRKINKMQQMKINNMQ